MLRLSKYKRLKPSRGNLWVQLRIGEGGIVELVVAPSAEAVQLDKNVFPELGPVGKSEPGGPDDVLRVVSVGVDDWTTNKLAEIWAVPVIDDNCANLLRLEKNAYD